MMVRVTFLGTGSALPNRGGSNCAYFIQAGSARILIDCGPSILQQLDAAGLSPGDITHVFVTHRHGDHALGYPMLVLWWALKRRGSAHFPTVFAGPTTARSLDGLVEHSYGDAELTARSREIPRVVLAEDRASAVRINDQIVVRAWPMTHSEWAPVLGARFEISDAEAPDMRPIVLAFTGDTSPNEAVVALARDADLIVHDAAGSATLRPDMPLGEYGHSSAEAAARLARRAGARHLALVHLEGENVDAKLEGIYLAEATRVFDGAVSAPVAGHTLDFQHGET